MHSHFDYLNFKFDDIGDILLSLSAKDPDDEQLEFGVMGEYYNKLFEVRKIDGKNANVILKQILDREVFIVVIQKHVCNVNY